MIKSVLMFGGTFDPVHNGHVSFLKSAVSLVCPDKILIIPCSIPPHKAAAATNATLRAQMCSALCSVSKNAEVFDFEITRGGKSYTIDTVLQVQALYKDAKIYLCAGSDMLLYFRKWHMWQQLIEKVTIVVQNRAEKDNIAVLAEAKILTAHGAKIILANAQPIDVSSTQIRQLFAQKSDITQYVPAEVYEIIAKNNLYKEKTELSQIEAEQIAKETLSKKRFTHTINVKNLAVALAQKYGANTEKAAIAALLHDICKEISKTEMLQILHQDVIIAANCEKRPYSVWHAAAGAITAKTKYNILDTEILDAICYHTTGRANMSKLDKIVFMADMVCEDRDYKEVTALRQLAWQNLDAAVLETLNQKIKWLANENRPIDDLTKKAYEHLLLKMEDITFE